jgi:hypothetical protein
MLEVGKEAAKVCCRIYGCSSSRGSRRDTARLKRDLVIGLLREQALHREQRALGLVAITAPILLRINVVCSGYYSICYWRTTIIAKLKQTMSYSLMLPLGRIFGLLLYLPSSRHKANWVISNAILVGLYNRDILNRR